jgi:prolyl-tRNA editing enzyme YbaK/EbsC (Cys-tRNA(Pro) deacylase)
VVGVADIASVLESLGVHGTVRTLTSPARTAALAAGQLGCDVGAIANSLVFDAGGSPVLIMTSGAHRVDTAFVASSLGVASVVRAAPEQVRLWTGQAIGGVAPVGHPEPLRTLVDEWLARYEVIWAAAGSPHTVFPTSYDELLRITSGSPVSVAP